MNAVMEREIGHSLLFHQSKVLLKMLQRYKVDR